LGDGSTSTDENPTHEYVEYGAYTVILYLHGIVNDSKKIRYSYINVVPDCYRIQDVVDPNNPAGIWITKLDDSVPTVNNSQIYDAEDIIVQGDIDPYTLLGEFDSSEDSSYDVLQDQVTV
jgi:PKD repeat protein